MNSQNPHINLWTPARPGPSTRTDAKRTFLVTLRGCLFALLLISPLATMAQGHPGEYLMQRNDKTPTQHTFFDNTNLKLQGMNVTTQTIALLAIQSHSNGGRMAPCTKSPCSGALEARGRTLDPYEKHFESYGYGWGAFYRYGGGVGLNLLASYALHATGHHKLERWMPVIAIAHAQASTGFALTGSRQGKNGW
ncbi:MAG TPA: hypothetical protein VK638_36265 [Edaphobacter sp.]|nr:hypothetical protein [Edaphobacter sp.]